MMDQTRGDHALQSNAVHVRIYLWNDRFWREAATRSDFMSATCQIKTSKVPRLYAAHSSGQSLRRGSQNCLDHRNRLPVNPIDALGIGNRQRSNRVSLGNQNWIADGVETTDLNAWNRFKAAHPHHIQRCTDLRIGLFRPSVEAFLDAGLPRFLILKSKQHASRC